MLAAILEVLSRTAKWSNANEGLLTLGIFLSTLFLGWVSGIFASLRNKPRFHLSLIEGPTFSRTFETGKKHAGFPVHRTGIALYLTVANIGSAPSSIRSISVGYHWHLRPFSMQWLSYRIGWFWLHDQVVALQDFQSTIGDNIKIYPFLSLFKAVHSPSHRLRPTWALENLPAVSFILSRRIVGVVVSRPLKGKR